jgi:hypothetical protein
MWANVHAAELYRSIDKDGKVHYSDTPLEGSEDFEKLRLAKDPVLDVPLTYETQRAKQNFPVTLYAFPDCGSACQQARDFLNKRGIPFTEKSLILKEEIDAFRKDSGDSKLPAATVGKAWLRGFQPDQWNSELDIAGYPKRVLNYRPPVPAVTPAKPAQ